MKKWLVVLLIVIVLVIVYIILPAEIYVNQRVSVKVNSASAYRSLSDQVNWTKWWPRQNAGIATKDHFSLEQYSYSLQQNFFQSMVVEINGGDKQINSTLMLIPLGVDYTIFEWKALVQGGLWQKIRTYLNAKRIQGQMEDLLRCLKEYMEREENLYGFKVKYSKVKDTMLVTTKFTTTAYPATSEIYQHISLLKSYITAQGAAETNYPMLHVKQWDSNHFENMVAIPVNRALNESRNIIPKRMVAGNILEAEVRGGPATAQEAMTQLGYYREDRQLTSPAIPFMSLVTDRRKEMDTTKWVTKIYYPVL